ncbi:MAG: hypothetical protein NC206_10290 [Bacteroides sp.]|nr:hypothetical protein [Roseburia sp.]MCM1347456.1 hypothetical protein [Bacteroides sp.]MCM1421560.1 hypothetical protein [Bacteroides sp.]
MNATVYLFGEFNNGYSQYPDDYTAGIFKQFYAHAKSTTQVAIHRDGNLMYYGYIRKIINGKYIGLCVVLNGLYLENTDGLFSLFENTISSMALKGQLIHFSDNGELTTSVDRLYLNQEEIDLLAESLRAGFNSFGPGIKHLPPVSYATAKDSIFDFSIDDETDDIVKSSYTNGYTYIYKSKNYNTAQMNSYRGVLSKISKENNRLKKENYDLQTKNKKLKTQNRPPYELITVFFILAAGASIIGTLLDRNTESDNDIIKGKQKEIKEKDATISKLNDKIYEMTEQIEDLQYSLSKETDWRMATEISFEKFKSSIASLPLFITNIQVANQDKDGNLQTNYGETIYASNSMFLTPKITYTGIRAGESITLYVKFYDSSGTLITGNKSPKGYSYTEIITISSGSGNTCMLSGWGNENKGYYGKGGCRFEVWYGNICLGSKTFILY